MDGFLSDVFSGWITYNNVPLLQWDACHPTSPRALLVICSLSESHFPSVLLTLHLTVSLTFHCPAELLTLRHRTHLPLDVSVPHWQLWKLMLCSSVLSPARVWASPVTLCSVHLIEEKFSWPLLKMVRKTLFKRNHSNGVCVSGERQSSTQNEDKWGLRSTVWSVGRKSLEGNIVGRRILANLTW